MNIKISGYELKKVLDKFKNIISPLSIKTNNYNAILTVANSNIIMEDSVRCEVCECGQVLIPHELLGMLATIESDIIITDIKIKYESGEITYNNSSDRLFKDEKYCDNRIFSIRECELYTLLNNTKYAMAKDSARPIITGINFKNNKVAAVDGFRLSVEESTCNIESPITIPGDLVKLLLKVLKKKSYDRVYFDTEDTSSYIKLTIGNLIIISRLLEGEFIKYNSIIPQDYKFKIKVDPKELLKMFKKAFKCKSTTTEVAIFKIEDDKLTVINYTSEFSLKDTMSINISEHGELPFKIGFNPIYMVDSLKKYKEPIELEFTNSEAPIVIKSGGSLDMILPIRINGGLNKRSGDNHNDNSTGTL